MMVMQRSRPHSAPPRSGVLIALAAGILLLGAGFLYAYDTLRSSNIAGSGPARGAAASAAPSADYVPRGDDQVLIEMGIDPADSDLSPAALAAIARAHRAAQAAEGSAEGSGAAGEGAENAGGGPAGADAGGTEEGAANGGGTGSADTPAE